MAIGEIGLTSSMRSNLISLQTTARLLGTTEERLSTGKRDRKSTRLNSSH